MTSALIVGCVRSTWRMLLESESRRLPKTRNALEAAVPLGAMLTPLGGSVRDRRGARVVANEEKDVAVDDTSGAPGLPPVEAKDVSLNVSDSVPEAPPVECREVRIDVNDSVPEAPLVEVTVGPRSVPISELEKIFDDIDDVGIDPTVDVGRLRSWVLFVDPPSVACPFEPVVETAVLSKPGAILPLELVTRSDDPQRTMLGMKMRPQASLR